LQEVGRHNFAPVSVKEGKSRAECRSRDTPKDSLGNDTSPAGLGGVDGYRNIKFGKVKAVNCCMRTLVEEVVKEK